MSWHYSVYPGTLATAKEYEERRQRGYKAAWRDKFFAWLTYEAAPADSDANGNGAPAELPVSSLPTKKSKPHAYKM